METPINLNKINRADVLKVNIELQEKHYATATDENYKSYLHRDIFRMKQELNNINSNKKYN